MMGQAPGPERPAGVGSLRARLADAEDTLRAIRNGEVDAFVVSGDRGDEVHILGDGEVVYRQFIEAIAGTATLSSDGTILSCDAGMATTLRLPLEQVVGSPFEDHVSAEDRESLSAVLAQPTALSDVRKITLVTGDAELVPAYLSATLLQGSDPRPVTGLMVTDLEAVVSAEDALEESASQLVRVMSEAPIPMMIYAEDGEVMSVNRSWIEASGYALEDLPSLAAWAENAFGEPGESRQQETEEPPAITTHTHDGERTVRTADGEERVWDFRSAPLGVLADGRRLVITTAPDITERKQSEEALRESVRRSTELAERSGTFMWEVDAQGLYTYVSDVVEHVLGYRPDDLVGRMHFYDLHPEEEREAFKAAALAVFEKKGEFKGLLNAGQAKDGRRKWLSTNGIPVLDSKGILQGYRGSDMDVTERELAAEATRAIQEQHSVVLRTAMDGFWLVNAEGRILEVNDAYCQMSGYSEQELLKMCIADLEVLEKADDILARSRRILEVGQDRFETRHRRKDGSIFDIEALVTNVPGLEQLAVFIHDITDRKQAEEALRRALSSVVDVVAQIVETRDPYTAGHERRVSELSIRIAEEMGMSDEQIGQIRTAALVHDVGKISVPAEILSKPGRLTPVEFALVQVHSESGYNILTAANMEASITEMVYQHHERCDGSGYPRGQGGEDLLEGAKVLAVADVVEAMVSYRPYRTGMGVEAALAEIERGAGTQYDASVAEACFRVFREQGFVFSEI